MDVYRITKIRLIGFHNFVNETIEIRDGGHLFLLGDNGSGKTTVLDAVHYVLCPGRAMEFNAAARVAGARHAGGRTIHGVVMRYNLDANGPLMPNGGIAYAAIEIAGRHGKPVTAAVGVSTRGMEEDVERWFVLREGPVDALPLAFPEPNGGIRPATKTELKAALPGGYYGQVHAYIDDLARRFFHDRETYDDVCRLLATGKAYREIAARTSDYHQLFRQLLQEPPREVFEAVIVHLKSLEESRQDLDRLREKVAFVAELNDMQASVREARIDRAAAHWRMYHVNAREHRQAYDESTERLTAETLRLETLQSERERLDHSVRRADLRFAELRRQDAGGWIRQEQDARLALEKARQGYEASKRALIEARQRREDAGAACTRSRSALAKQADAAAAALRKAARTLPVSVSESAGRLEDAAKQTAPETVVAALAEPFALMREAADTRASALDRDLQAADEQLDRQEAQRTALASEIEAKRLEGEAIPRLPGFAAARRNILERMLPARPLYLGLEFAPGLTRREQTALEQLIGDAVLATWITDPENADALRRLLFADFPAQSLAAVGDETDLPPADWLRRYFDFQASEPAALLVLQHQLESRAGPRLDVFLDRHVLSFRLREQPLVDAAPRLIGAELRRRERVREIRELERRLDDAEKSCKATAALRDNLHRERSRLADFRVLLNSLEVSLTRQRDAVAEASTSESLAVQAFENGQAECGRREEEHGFAQDRHADCLVALRREGLEGLEDRLRKVEREANRLRREHENVIREAGRLDEALTRERQRGVELQAAIARALAGRDTVQRELLALVTPDGALDAFVRARCERSGDDAGALESMRLQAAETAAAAVERIRSAVRQPIATTFGFVYDETDNTLHDRRGRSIAAVRDGADLELREQEALISDETRRLFRRIVMEQLVETLQTSVLRLQGMAARINRRLKERAFGSNRYQFSIVPREERKRLVELVRGYRALNPERTETELREFIEDHAAEIQSAEVGEIPAILDYREWFRYELKVMTTTAEGIVMDRKVKSIGSGGEQAVPNYLLILTLAHFLFDKDHVRLPALIFDEAFYGIDAGRRDQLLGFANDLDLQLFVASPDQDGVKRDIAHSTSLLVIKDPQYNVHLYPYHWTAQPRQGELTDAESDPAAPPAFGPETC